MLIGFVAFSQSDSTFVFPDSAGWNVLKEDEVLSFQVKTKRAEEVQFSIEGAEGLNVQFDSVGNFNWKPSFDLVDRVSRTKDFTIVFQAERKDGKREKQAVTFTVHHVNRPSESFFETTEGETNRVPMRYIGFLNGSFKLNDQVILNPNIYYTNQANVSELVGGLNAHYNLSGDGVYQLIGGVYYRHKEAVIPMVGLGYNDITFTFSYDATISGLRNFNNSRGAFEFSLIKQGVLNPNGRSITPCPSFRTRGY